MHFVNSWSYEPSQCLSKIHQGIPSTSVLAKNDIEAKVHRPRKNTRTAKPFSACLALVQNTSGLTSDHLSSSAEVVASSKRSEQNELQALQHSASNSLHSSKMNWQEGDQNS